MKAPFKVSHRAPQQQNKKRVRDFSVFMFKARKEMSGGGMRTSDFFHRRGGFPRPVLLRLVSDEASRKSKTNRHKVVTLKEIQEAVSLIRPKIRARPAA